MHYHGMWRAKVNHCSVATMAKSMVHQLIIYMGVWCHWWLLGTLNRQLCKGNITMFYKAIKAFRWHQPTPPQCISLTFTAVWIFHFIKIIKLEYTDTAAILIAARNVLIFAEITGIFVLDAVMTLQTQSIFAWISWCNEEIPSWFMTTYGHIIKFYGIIMHMAATRSDKSWRCMEPFGCLLSVELFHCFTVKRNTTKKRCIIFVEPWKHI